MDHIKVVPNINVKTRNRDPIIRQETVIRQEPVEIKKELFKADDNDPDVQDVLKSKVDVLELESIKTKEENSSRSNVHFGIIAIIVLLVIILICLVVYYLFISKRQFGPSNIFQYAPNAPPGQSAALGQSAQMAARPVTATKDELDEILLNASNNTKNSANDKHAANLTNKNTAGGKHAADDEYVVNDGNDTMSSDDVENMTSNSNLNDNANIANLNSNANKGNSKNYANSLNRANTNETETNTTQYDSRKTHKHVSFEENNSDVEEIDTDNSHLLDEENILNAATNINDEIIEFHHNVLNSINIQDDDD
jgi:flagellar basal body-associated protein FliL